MIIIMITIIIMNIIIIIIIIIIIVIIKATLAQDRFVLKGSFARPLALDGLLLPCYGSGGHCGGIEAALRAGQGVLAAPS